MVRLRHLRGLGTVIVADLLPDGRPDPARGVRVVRHRVPRPSHRRGRPRPTWRLATVASGCSSLVIALMTGATAVVGVLPGYAAIGLAAPLALVLLRVAQGLAAGGELGVAAVFLVEHAPRWATRSLRRVAHRHAGARTRVRPAGGRTAGATARDDLCRRLVAGGVPARAAARAGRPLPASRVSPRLQGSSTCSGPTTLATGTSPRACGPTIGRAADRLRRDRCRIPHLQHVLRLHAQPPRAHHVDDPPGGAADGGRRTGLGSRRPP